MRNFCCFFKFKQDIKLKRLLLGCSLPHTLTLPLPLPMSFSFLNFFNFLFPLFFLQTIQVFCFFSYLHAIP